MAQMRTGTLYGKLTDEEGNPLPGVTLTLSGSITAPLHTVTSATGGYRFLSLPPAKDYIIKAELAGFKTEIRQGIIVAVGVSVELNLTMAVGKIEEEVTVVAVSPVVDTKKTSVGVNVTQDQMQSLPTARDPWVVLQMAPSIIVDRENVGGAESGQQSNYVARGASNYNNNVWSMDGIVITDPAAIGASPSYYDFDAFEEMQIIVGGADVTVQTGGVALNMITHRGSNKISLGGRFYLTDSKFQAKNQSFVDAKILENTRVSTAGVSTKYFYGLNLINNNKDYGFNLGGPLVKDKAWLWGSFGVQDIKTTTIYAQRDDTLLTNYVAKLNLQIIPQNRFEAFMHIGGKEKWGRSPSAANPEGLYQAGRYHFGSPVFKIQDEHSFGDTLFVSMKYAFSDAGFSMTPMTDLAFNQVAYWDDTAQRYYGNQASRYYVERPVNQFNFLVNYFNDNLLGASHDVKIGFEFADRNAYSESVNPGNMIVTRNYSTTTNTWDWSTPYNGTADPVPAANRATFKQFRFQRASYWTFSDLGVRALTGYVSDTISFGRFNLILGFRYDYQKPRTNAVSVDAVNDNPAWAIADPAVKAKLDSMLPAVDLASAQATYDNGIDGPGGDPFFWGVFSPRLSMTWDVFGDGKTIAKASFATYGDFMGMTQAGNMMPYGTAGRFDFWWNDTNANNLVEFPELYWSYIGNVAGYGTAYQPYRVFDNAGNVTADATQWANAYGTWWRGIADYLNPTATSPARTTYDKNTWGSSRIVEAMFTLDREIFTNFAVTLNASYRRFDHFDWTNKYFVNTVKTDPNYGARYGFQNTDWYIEQTLNVLPITIDPTKTSWDGNYGDATQYKWYSMKGVGYVDAKAPGGTYDPSYTSAYSLYTKQPGRYNDYYGLDLIFTKRLSNKWMFDGNITIQSQAAHYPAGSYWEATNLWALDGKDYSASMGSASGKINQYVFSRWMVKASGLYQFPLDINAAFTFMAREGWIIQETMIYNDYNIPNARSRSYNPIYLHPFGTDRLNTFYRFDIRVEKMIKFGDTGRIWLMADIFNVFNSTLENRRYQKSWGTYNNNVAPTADTFTYDLSAYTLNEVLNPRVARLGVRFTF
jgi:hypothetical protein